MRLIKLYDTFLALGRLAVLIELGRQNKTDEQLNTMLNDFCEQGLDRDIALNLDDAISVMGGESTKFWPPDNIAEFEHIFESLNLLARSGDPRLELFWRIATALGWTLFTPIPEGEESKKMFCNNLYELGISHEETNGITAALSSTEERQRIEAGEQIRHFVRKLSVSDEYSFLASKPSHQEAMTSVSHMPVFHRRSVPMEQDLVFVLMPFGESWSEYIWKEEIQKSVHKYQKAKLNCIRADDLFGHDVMLDTYESIAKARIVIADITNRNANVFYELGIAHCIGKDVILLSQGADHIPFDLLRFRHCIYSNDGPGYKVLREYLPKAIESILNDEISSYNG
jgi:hypothetical protein